MSRRRANLATWTKSSYSAVNGDCVEVRADDRELVHVRDSKTAQGPLVGFRSATWSAFLSDVRRGTPSG